MLADIITLAVLLAFIFWGTKRGLAKMAFSAVSYALSLVAGCFLYRPLNSFLVKMKIAEGLALKMEKNAVIEKLPGVMQDLPFVSSDDVYGVLASAAVTLVSFLSVVIIVRLVIFLVSMIIGAANSLPVIHQANSLAGGIMGFVIGLLFELIVFAAMGALEAFGTLSIAGQLDGSLVASLIYNNNPLLELIIG